MPEPRKRKSAAARKAEIVETAIRLSADIGPDRVTTQHLANEVGVTQPAIFRHFSTKSQIWDAVADHIVGEMRSLHRHGAEIDGDAHAVLHRMVGHHLSHVRANPAIPAILFSRELQAENSALRSKFAQVLTDRRKAFATLVRKAQRDGLHRSEIVASDAAQLIVASLYGLVMRWSVENHGFDLVDEGGRVIGGLIDSFRV